MRKRTVQLNIRLTEAKNKRLKQHSRKSGQTASAYVRLLINGFQPKETPPIDYHKLMNSLYELNAKLPQSAIFSIVTLTPPKLHLCMLHYPWRCNQCQKPF